MEDRRTGRFLRANSDQLTISNDSHCHFSDSGTSDSTHNSFPSPSCHIEDGVVVQVAANVKLEGHNESFWSKFSFRI
jgi:hypothetical protein